MKPAPTATPQVKPALTAPTLGESAPVQEEPASALGEPSLKSPALWRTYSITWGTSSRSKGTSSRTKGTSSRTKGTHSSTRRTSPSSGYISVGTRGTTSAVTVPALEEPDPATVPALDEPDPAQESNNINL